jgi:hypothetical protein
MFKEETETMTKVRCEGRNTVTKTDQIKLRRYGHLLKWAADSLWQQKGNEDTKQVTNEEPKWRTQDNRSEYERTGNKEGWLLLWEMTMDDNAFI